MTRPVNAESSVITWREGKNNLLVESVNRRVTIAHKASQTAMSKPGTPRGDGIHITMTGHLKYGADDEARTHDRLITN